MTYQVQTTPYPKRQAWLGGEFKAIRYADRGMATSRRSLQHRARSSGQKKNAAADDGGSGRRPGGLVFHGEGNGWFRAYD